MDYYNLALISNYEDIVKAYNNGSNIKDKCAIIFGLNTRNDYNLSIDFVATCKPSLYILCLCNNISMIEYAISIGINDVNYALFSACSVGYKDNEGYPIIQLLIKLAEDKCIKIHWDTCLVAVCKSNIQIEDTYPLIDLLIQKGSCCNFGPCLYQACIKDNPNRKLIDYLINCSNAKVYNYGLKGACEAGHEDLVDYMIQLGANNWNSGLKGASKGNKAHLASLMLQKGANNIEECLQYASMVNHTDVVKILIDVAEVDVLNTCVTHAHIYNNWDTFNYLITHGGHHRHKYSKDYYKYLLDMLSSKRTCINDLCDQLKSIIELYI